MDEQKKNNYLELLFQAFKSSSHQTTRKKHLVRIPISHKIPK